MPLPHDENVDALYSRFKRCLWDFSGAPWTIQRLCELLLEPRKQYSQLHKLVRGLPECVGVCVGVCGARGGGGSHGAAAACCRAGGVLARWPPALHGVRCAPHAQCSCCWLPVLLTCYAPQLLLIRLAYSLPCQLCKIRTRRSRCAHG